MTDRSPSNTIVRYLFAAAVVLTTYALGFMADPDDRKRRSTRAVLCCASGDHEVVFQLADTGCGIAPEDLPRVFDRFWQATRASYQGAGLGLPITKGIVETHGGRIWVESSEGLGTTVSFTIPTAAPCAPASSLRKV